MAFTKDRIPLMMVGNSLYTTAGTPYAKHIKWVDMKDDGAMLTSDADPDYNVSMESAKRAKREAAVDVFHVNTKRMKTRARPGKASS